MIIKLPFKIPKFDAIVLYPFIFIEKSASQALIEHEKIHLRQAQKYYIFLFYVLYLFSRKWRLKFEVEAYKQQIRYGASLEHCARSLLKYKLKIDYNQAIKLLSGDQHAIN